jgi:hypothetical protein
MRDDPDRPAMGLALVAVEVQGGVARVAQPPWRGGVEDCAAATPLGGSDLRGRGDEECDPCRSWTTPAPPPRLGTRRPGGAVCGRLLPPRNRHSAAMTP